MPTVWSNCLAGWLLGGGGSFLTFVLLSLGTTCLYLGGMYLNDAFDANFDRQYRQERPIPAGVIHESDVWLWGCFWLLAGSLSLFTLGGSTAVLTLLLVSAIVLYDAIHKVITFSPLLIAFCRFLLYLAAASSARQGITGLTLWSALALAAYVVGLSYLARRESVPQAVRYWPCSLLAAPVVLALLANGGPYWNRAVLLAVILGTWVIRCLGHAFSSNTRNVGRAVSGLLAGIVLVDLLAVAGGTPFVGFLFLVFFGAALLLQRVVPAK